MFKLFSQYDCLLKLNGQEITLEENENLTIEQPCSVLVYPVGKAKAFSFAIDLNKLSDSAFYKFKKIEDQTYIFLIEFFRRQSQDVYNYSLSGKPCQVFVGTDKICFLSETQKIDLAIPFQFEKYTCKKIQSLILVMLETSQEKHLVVFNPKNNKIKLFNGQIELEEQGFSISKQYFDCQYKIDNSGLKNTGYKNSKKIPSSLLPYQFMEAVKNQVFSLAHHLLSANLQETISIASLKQYLPDVQYFKFIDQNHCFAICSSKCHSISFSLTDESIEEVEID